MPVENISLFNSVLDEALERLGKKNLKLKECQYEAVKAVVVDQKDTIWKGLWKVTCIPASSLRVIESIYFQRMHSTGDIQFFVCVDHGLSQSLRFLPKESQARGTTLCFQISKDRTVSHCIRHWPSDGMSGISPLNGLKIVL